MVNMAAKFDDDKYSINELSRITTAPPHKSTTITKYIAPRTLGVNMANSHPGSLRNFILSAIGPTVKSVPVPAGAGLAPSVSTSSLSTLSSLHSVGGDQLIDEERELSKITRTLTESIVQCCGFEVHNQALEMQIDWLQNNASKNSATIDRMFLQEMQTARELIDDASRYKPDLETKLRDLHQTTLANDDYYQQLLSKRNTSNKDVFEQHRKSAQIRAEAEFLRYRMEQFKDEIQFYTVKNESLQIRKVKLRYELDEEIFAKQVLQSELAVLESEKISNEDVHLAAIEDVRGSTDVSTTATMQSATYYREQLTHQVRRSRMEYETKIQKYRDELHRKFELELHRYHMHKTRPVPGVTKEHEQKLDQFHRERKSTEQQISSVRGAVQAIQGQIETLQKQIAEEKIDERPKASAEKQLKMVEQMIHEREKQVADALRIRTELKQRIDKYRSEIDWHKRRARRSTYEIKPAAATTMRKSILRSSSVHDVTTEYHPAEVLSSRMASGKFSSLQDLNRMEHVLSPEGTHVRFQNFDAKQDCRELNTIFDHMYVDEAAVIRILCNRNAVQRIQIRDLYKDVFQKNLINVIETTITGDSRKILKILLLSSVERDCYELRRLLQTANLDENVLIEIFLTNSNRQIKTILSYYHKLFGSTVESDILANRDTPSTRIFLALLQANRPEEDEVDEDEVFEDARNLSDSRAKWQADGSTFIRLLCNRSNAHLKQTFAVYQRFGKVDIEESIRTNVSADLSRTLMAIVRIIRHPAQFFADELNKSFQGLNANEDSLTRIIVSRNEIDMVQIKSAFENITHRSLTEHIQTHTKGNYQKALLELLRHRTEPSRGELPFSARKRPIVQWKEPLPRQTLRTNVESRDVNTTRFFDRDNQAKSATLSTINTKPSCVLFSELRTSMGKRRYFDENDYEE